MRMSSQFLTQHHGSGIMLYSDECNSPCPLSTIRWPYWLGGSWGGGGGRVKRRKATWKRREEGELRRSHGLPGARRNSQGN